jgi:penicillin amidase
MTESEYRVPGLSTPADILLDAAGIAHIRAETRRDVFLAQGFNAARARLWQIDLWRKRGLGLLASDHGPGFLAQDRACRLFLYRGDIAAEWAAYGPEAQGIVTAFAEGINAFVALTERDPACVPPEFRALGVKPARWTPEDIVRIRSHALIDNLASEVARARVRAAGGDDLLDGLRKRLSPPWTPMAVPGAGAPIPAEVLDVYRLARAEPGITAARRAASLGEAWAWSKLTTAGEVTSGDGGPADTSAEGSNNWVLAGSRTASGRPILANDPHRAYGLPSLRSIVHLTVTGDAALDIIGAGEPALPGISIGHNGRLAFGLTIFPADQEDLMVYETDPQEPMLYRYGQGWERMVSLTEAVPVRGEADQPVTLLFTRHGPVIHQDLEAHRAYAVRTVWSEPGAAAYLGSLRYLDAETPEDFAAALAHWRVPPVNQVHAGKDGQIGWIAAAAVPRRPNWDGLTPVPGDGRFEWDGFWQGADLPRRLNPAEGFIATANALNLPHGYPAADRRLGFEWYDRFRADRLDAVLADGHSLTLDDSQRLQTDRLSEPALRLTALLTATGLLPPLLSGWDCRITAESAAAALFEVWWSRHLKPAVVAARTPSAAVAALLAPGDSHAILETLESPEPFWPVASRNAALAGTLQAAMEDCATLMGPDPSGWAWGRLHRQHFAHGLGRLLPTLEGYRLDLEPLPVDGSGATVGLSEYRPDDFGITIGASFRMVLDVGDWDRSRVINAPGQSGDPASPHYADLVDLWAAGGFVPLLYSRAAVDAAVAHRIRLVPASASTDGKALFEDGGNDRRRE